MKIVAVLQARMSSTRLPGKMLAPIAGRPLLQLMIERMRKSAMLSEIIVATSTNRENDVIERLCRKLGVRCFRGSENDVLSRFLSVARQTNADHIMRVCGDQPFIDPAIIDDTIQSHLKSGADYTSTALKRTFPTGVDVELITRDALFKLEKIATTAYEREHVTVGMCARNEFKLNNINAPHKLRKPRIQLCIDTAKDLRYARKLYEALGDVHASTEQVIRASQRKDVRRRPLIVFRADGSVSKGMGHLVTCFKLAARLRKEYDAEVLFFSQNHPEGIAAVKKQGYPLIVLPANRSTRAEASPDEAQVIPKLLRDLRPDVYYTDFLHMPNNYAPALRALGIKTVSGDIPGTMHFAPDVIINRSLLKRRLQGYAGKPSKVYAGPDYMILDNAFAKSHGRKRVIRHPVRNILLTFGGSDVMNLTPKVLRALERVQTNAGITVVLGSAYAHRHALQQVLARLKRQVCIVQDVNNLSELMMQADVAIASGGRTLYELACTGTPALILCAEPEQLVNLQEFQGIVEGLGLGRKVPMSTLARAITRLLENPQVRASMSKKGKELVDGKGLERVVKIIAQLLGTGS